MNLEQRRRANNWFFIEHIDRYAVDKHGEPLSQAEAAKYIGISMASIANISAGRNGVSPETLLATLQAFPPKSWEEVRDIGQKWVPACSIKEKQDEYPKVVKFFIDHMLTYQPYLTQADLGRLLNLSTAALSYSLLGNRPFSIEIASRTLEKFPPHTEQERIDFNRGLAANRKTYGLQPDSRRMIRR